MRFFSASGMPVKRMEFHATSTPSIESYALYTVLNAPLPISSVNCSVVRLAFVHWRFGVCLVVRNQDEGVYDCAGVRQRARRGAR